MTTQAYTPRRAGFILPVLMILVFGISPLFAGGSSEVPEGTPAQVTGTGSGPEADESREETGISQPARITSREEAIEVLRTIGMTIFEEEVEAPDFSLMDTEGNEVSLSDYRGKVVFLNFWATWCGPCRVEMPSMNDLYADLKDEDFVMLAVNQREDLSLVNDFLEETGYSFPVILDDDGIVSYQYGIRGIPTTYIIAPDGTVLAGKIGTHIYDGQLYRDLFRLLM